MEHTLENLFFGFDLNPLESRPILFNKLYRYEYEDQNSRPTFKIEAGKINDWNIDLPDEVLNVIRNSRALGSFDLQLGSVVSGRIVGIVPINKDSSVHRPDLLGDYKGHTGLYNSRGGARVCLNWTAIPPDLKTNQPNGRYLLALYAKDSNIRYSAGSIETHALLDDWIDNPALEESPQFASEPFASFSPVKDEGWKLFDITPYFDSRATNEATHHGVMLKFAREDHPSDDLSGYTFLSSEAEGDWANKRPLLLIVDPDE